MHNVVDWNNKADGSKPWDLSKTWSVEIDYRKNIIDNIEVLCLLIIGCRFFDTHGIAFR